MSKAGWCGEETARMNASEFLEVCGRLSVGSERVLGRLFSFLPFICGCAILAHRFRAHSGLPDWKHVARTARAAPLNMFALVGTVSLAIQAWIGDG